ncbi:MAG: hypothetical protein PHX43_07090, partial [Alphaproteobacteria bacterium]|nr:hypothetical protein [Alphaproteobacteria bacterium]
MKIAVKFYFATILGVLSVLSVPAFAQDAAKTSATPSNSGIVMSSVPNSAVVRDFSDDDKSDISSVKSGKVPDSIKGVVKRLGVNSSDVNLDDLNSAREAIAKLDILIDIEKRLTDLSKIRQERDEKSSITPISASSLFPKSVSEPQLQRPLPVPAAPVVASSAPAPAPIPAISAHTPSSDVSIERISGAGGTYSAVIKVNEGKARIIREGDKISDGSIVRSISK